MKQFIFAAIFALCFLSLHAQDILVRKGGEVENVKVLEVSPTEVKYKKSDNPDGPVFVEKRLNLYSVKYQNGEVQTFKDNENEGSSIYKGYGKEKKITHEANLYIGTGWGVGYQLRREFNQYIGWNIVGISYMSDYNFEDMGVFFKLLGARGYTPADKAIRGYADLNIGYAMCNFGNNLGIEFGLGIQVHKRFALGYNLIYLTPNSAAVHMAKLSFLF